MAIVSTSSSLLTDDDIDYIYEIGFHTFSTELVARNYVGLRTVDPGTLSVTNFMYSDMSEAADIGERGEFPRDVVTRSEASIFIMKKGLGFEISREAILAARRAGEPIESRNMESVARRIAEAEDDMILSGMAAFATANSKTWTASTDGGTGVEWGSAGFDPYNDIVDICYEFGSGRRCSTIFVAPNVYKYLEYQDANGNIIIDQLNRRRKKVNVVECEGLAAGKAIAFDSRYVTEVIAEDFMTEPEYRTGNQVFLFNAWERVALEISDTDSVLLCDLTTPSANQ